MNSPRAKVLVDSLIPLDLVWGAMGCVESTPIPGRRTALQLLEWVGVADGRNGMIRLLSRSAFVALILSLSIGAASLAFAKGHDGGVADGSRGDPSTLRGGGVAGVDIAGIGSVAFGLCKEGFCGVVGDPGQTYGQDIVAVQVAEGTIRVVPVVPTGQEPPR